MAHVEFLGMDRLISRVANFHPALDEGSVKGVQAVAEKIRDAAKEKVRVDTGSLQRSIRVGKYSRPAANVHSIRVTAGGYVRNPKTGRLVDYAIPQEFGTSKMSAQPYLGPAVQEHGRELTKEIKKAIAR